MELFVGISNTERPEGLTFSSCILTVVANASDPIGENSVATTRMSYLEKDAAMSDDTKNAADTKLFCDIEVVMMGSGVGTGMLILYNGYDITKYYF